MRRIYTSGNSGDHCQNNISCCTLFYFAPGLWLCVSMKLRLVPRILFKPVLATPSASLQHDKKFPPTWYICDMWYINPCPTLIWLRQTIGDDRSWLSNFTPQLQWCGGQEHEMLSGHPAGIGGWVARVEYALPKRYTCQAVRSGCRG